MWYRHCSTSPAAPIDGQSDTPALVQPIALPQTGMPIHAWPQSPNPPILPWCSAVPSWDLMQGCVNVCSTWRGEVLFAFSAPP